MNQQILSIQEQAEIDFYSYQVSVNCTNCGLNGKIRILKGNTVSNTKCPECSCYNLIKS